MLTLAQLITPVTEDEALDAMITVLSQLGFQATSWSSNAIQRIVLRMFARFYVKITELIAEIAGGGFTTLAVGGWLTLLARYVYNLERIEATQTIGQILLTSSAGAPVHTWSAGDIIVADAPIGTDGANSYTCTAGGSLGPSATLLLEFKADIAGDAANIAPNTTLYLWTPLVGVTVTNPVYLTTNTWITTVGLDEESDQRLAQRCLARWYKLSYGNMDGAYKGWALDALPTLTRVSIASAPGDATVTIIGATALGPISGSEATTIEDYVNGVTDGIGRRPLNDIVSAIPATTYSPAYTPTLNVEPSVVDSIASTVTKRLLDYAGSVPIGGFKLISGNGIVPFADLVQIAQSTPGVRSLSGFPTADISLSSTQIFTPTFDFTVNQVAPGA